MKNKIINFRIEEKLLSRFSSNKKARNFKSNVDYFRFLIHKDFDEISDNKFSDRRMKRELDELRDLIQEHLYFIKSNSTPGFISYKDQFNLILNVLYRLLSLQIEPFPDDDSHSVFDEQRVGEEKALKIIRENIKEFI